MQTTIESQQPAAPSHFAGAVGGQRRAGASSMPGACVMLLRGALVGLFVVSASAQTDTSSDALFAAIHKGAAGDVARVLESGVSPNLVDADGVPAVMAATLFGDAQLVDLILKRGADPNRAGPAGTRELKWAVPHERSERWWAGWGGTRGR